MLRPQQPPPFLRPSPPAARACEGELCSNLSNFNYKSQVESRPQHMALYMDRHLRSLAIVIEVTSHHTECTHFNLDYSQMPAVALQCLAISNNLYLNPKNM